MTNKPQYFTPQQKIHTAILPGTPQAGFVIGPYRKSDNIWYEKRLDGNEYPLFPSSFQLSTPTLPADAGKIPQVQTDGSITWVAVPSGGTTLPAGTNGQILTYRAGGPVWETPAITVDKFGPSKDDDGFLIADADGLTKLPKGEAGQFLRTNADGTKIRWSDVYETISICEFLTNEEVVSRLGLVYFVVTPNLNDAEIVAFQLVSHGGSNVLPASSCSYRVLVQQNNSSGGFDTISQSDEKTYTKGHSGTIFPFNDFTTTIPLKTGNIIRLNITSVTQESIKLTGFSISIMIKNTKILND